jgi:transposase
MGRPPSNPLRPLTEQERSALVHIARASSERAIVVTWAKEVLEVDAGATYHAAAVTVGRHVGDQVSQLVARFNREGLSALVPRNGGGRKPTYSAAERERILSEARRKPDPEQDGTANWSLMTLRSALRRAPDGLPHVSTYTIGQVLHAAGFRWVGARSWCETGKAIRKRRSGNVTVVDADAEAKKKSD